MARLVKIGILAAATAVWALSGNFLAAAPAWESGGRPLEVSDLPSVVVTPRPTLAAGQPPLPPEPETAEQIDLPAPQELADGVVVEDQKVPTLGGRAAASLGERMQEFIPSSPDMLTFDSAVAIEPDGTVVPCSTKRGFWDCLNCCEDACWVARFEALALWRSAPASRPLFTTLTNYNAGDPGAIPPVPPTGTIGPVALDANQLVSDPAAAGRLSLARLDECGKGFDAAYIWAGNFYSQRSLPELANGYALAYPGLYGNSWGLIPPAPPISSASATLVGSLQSAEFNYREPLGWGANRFLIGFRWLQWRESFSLTDSYIDPLDTTVTGTDFYKTSSLNNLYGGQIGLDSMLWNSGKGVRLEGLVKAGAYYNAAVQSSGYYYVNTAPFQSPYATITVNHPPTCSFMGEVGLTGVVPLGKNLDLRCGYVGMWLTGLAQPTRQLSGQSLIPTAVNTPQGTLTTNGTVILQGVSLGLEGRW